jgi:hypothetical protein
MQSVSRLIDIIPFAPVHRDAVVDVILLVQRDEFGIEITLGGTSRRLAAHRFCERNGFVEIDRKRLRPAFPIMAVDTKFYRRTI